MKNAGYLNQASVNGFGTQTFVITEPIRTQFRAESFNFLNKVNLANPNTSVDCPGTAGRIFGTFANYIPRQWQLALKAEF